MKGIDYSWGRPGGRRIKKAGYDFVCRYLSNTKDKNLSADELEDLHSNDLTVVLVWETSAQRTQEGFKAGVTDAKIAKKMADELGCPECKPIYFAADDDFSEKQQPAINEYFKGVASVLPMERIGVYGGYFVVKRLIDAKLVTYVWQTAAWSQKKWHDKIHIKQYKFNQILSKVTVDFNESVQDDFGQW